MRLRRAEHDTRTARARPGTSSGAPLPSVHRSLSNSIREMKRADGTSKHSCHHQGLWARHRTPSPSPPTRGCYLFSSPSQSKIFVRLDEMRHALACRMEDDFALVILGMRCKYQRAQEAIMSCVHSLVIAIRCRALLPGDHRDDDHRDSPGGLFRKASALGLSTIAMQRNEIPREWSRTWSRVSACPLSGPSPIKSHREISRVTTSAQLHMVALGQQSRAMCHDEPKLAPASTEGTSSDPIRRTKRPVTGSTGVYEDLHTIPTTQDRITAFITCQRIPVKYHSRFNPLEG
ncbi:hypothetical protein V8E55_010689 [Tylopilus felleus]